MIYKNHYQGKTVIITGHTGFKGAWLTTWLTMLGAKVIGVALEPVTEPSLFNEANLSLKIENYFADIRDKKKIENIFLNTKPDFVFHLAAQALVRKSYDDPVNTWETNVIGTLNVLEALRKIKNSCSAVIVTSDKCYDNVEWIWGYRETDTLGGADPYSASKGAAELVINSYVKSFFSNKDSNVCIASARAGNVIGGGDWSSDRVIPDCIRAWCQNKCVELRSPNATRPWQHVLEPLSGYMQLAVKIRENSKLNGEAFNFGPSEYETFSVMALVKEMSLHWDAVKWKDVSNIKLGPHEASLLKLNCDKAYYYLNWRSALSFSEAIKMTVEWYKKFYEEPSNIFEMTCSQIKDYILIAKNGGVDWAK